MGFRISLLACEPGEAEGVLSALALTRTGEPDAVNETPQSGGRAGDWYVVWRNWSGPGPFADAELGAASARRRILTLDVSETVMYARAGEWRDGSPTWTVWASDGDEQPLATEGDPPAELAGAIEAHRGAIAADPQIEDSDFEIPVGLFVALTGFTYDALRGDDEVFEALAAAPKKPWWRVW